MKKLLFALPVLAIAFIFSYCSRPTVEEELNNISPNSVVDERGGPPVPAGCSIRVRINTPCEQLKNVYWSVSLTTASSINGDCTEPASLVAEFGHTVENPNEIILERTIQLPPNGACFHVYGSYPIECSPMELIYTDVNGEHTISVPEFNLDPNIPCATFCASCLGQ